ncbi:MAG TPA: hypothetical protein VF892_04995 [Pseudonocardiaceae bacterium]
MQAVLPRSAVPVADDPAPGSDLMITMLDGGLGAVAPAGVPPRADTVCYCPCIICGAPSTVEQ